MSNALLSIQKKRRTRAMRVRKKLRGTSLKPRLSVHKSNCHIQAQLIDDETGKTLCGVATYSAEFRETEFGKKNKASAAALGARIAEKAKEYNVKEIVFDRGPFKYCGVLAALADAARSAGLQF
ncbi:MAG: 50S ribosomal protein L18 [Parachlamydiaceae bacterium]